MHYSQVAMGSKGTAAADMQACAQFVAARLVSVAAAIRGMGTSMSTMVRECIYDMCM